MVGFDLHKGCRSAVVVGESVLTASKRVGGV